MKSQGKTIIKRMGKMPGKTVAIFGGVHGDEKVGVMIIDYLLKNLEVTRGTVYLVYANPMAIRKNVRYIEKNLNRLFTRRKKHETCEEKRAKELMDILDKCDALLDLHAYSEPLGESIPFLITEDNSEHITKNMDFGFIAKGIDTLEKGGTDGYMSNQEKIGICAELGSIEKPEKFITLGIQTVYQFLQSFDMVDEKYTSSKTNQTKIKFELIYPKKTKDFKFTKKYKTFDKIHKGEIICIDGKEEVISPFDGYILFPRPNYEPGIEAFLLARKI